MTISATAIEKAYGESVALRDVDLTVHESQAVVLFGPNGAGKTTLLRILATLTKPDSGQVSVSGYNTATDGERARQMTGTLLHSPMLYADLTARENLRFFARMFGLKDIDRRVNEIAERLQFARRLDDRVRSLSHGLVKRVGLGRALLHAPRLLLLDEPESGLDQGALKLFEGVIAEYRQDGRSVVMTTHDVGRGMATCDRAVVLSRGRVVLEVPGGHENARDIVKALRETAAVVS